MVASYDPSESSSASEEGPRTPSFSSSSSEVIVYTPRNADLARFDAELDEIDAEVDEMFNTNDSDQISSVLGFSDEQSFIMSRTADWAEQQSSESSGLNYVPVFRVRTSNPSFLDFGAYTEVKENAEPQVSTDPSSPVPDPASFPRARANRMIKYSIATLFSMSHLALPSSHKYDTPQDVTLAGLRKLTQSDVPPKKQENIRPRSQTASSNAAGLSTTDTDDAALYPASYIRPIRQPIQPPESILIQKHTGFVRFLKDHASPPHHRVTAGGRIVPAGPQSPPPMMFLPSINAVMGNSATQPFSNGQSNVPSSSTKALNSFKGSLPQSTGPLASQNINSNSQKAFEAPNQSSRPSMPHATSQNAQMQAPLLNFFGERLGPLPSGATTYGFMTDGSPLVHYNGMHWQTYWDGQVNSLKPLQVPNSGSMQTAYDHMGYSLPPLAPQYNGPYGRNSLGYPLDPMASFHNASGPTYPTQAFGHSGIAQPENPQGLHDHLAAELTALDKYVALHLHEFSVAENEGYTFRRRQLVEQLDHLRVSKENGQSSQPAIVSGYNGNAVNFTSNTHGSNRGTNNAYGNATQGMNQWNMSFTPYAGNSNSRQFPAAGPNVRLAATATPINKSLSPDAAPFIPSGMKPATLETVNGDQLLGSRAQVQPSQSATKAAQSSLTSPERNKEDKWYEDFGTGNETSKSAIPAIPPLSESHTAEALPVVTECEITYAKNVNPKGVPKVYCTTIEEFQEVIRRVREQAKMYGCKGGQSKDPAYDAEEDVRWAMADGDPIILPGSPADHVAHPRPWDWNDSAFNSDPRTPSIRRRANLDRREPSPYGLEGIYYPSKAEAADINDRAGTRSPWVRSPYLPPGPDSPPLDYEGVYKKFRAPYEGLSWEEHCAESEKIASSRAAWITSLSKRDLSQGVSQAHCQSSVEDAPTSASRSFQQAGYGIHGTKHDYKNLKGQQRGSGASGHDGTVLNGPFLKRDVSGPIDNKEGGVAEAFQGQTKPSQNTPFERYRAMPDGRAWELRDGASRSVSHNSSKFGSKVPKVNLPSASSHYAAFAKPSNVMQQGTNSTQAAVNFAK
ncbi:MAG: hypothetical protein Q9183_003629 [Haloplaca sp. 2 TL-2023]